MTKRKPQRIKIYEHMKNHGSITTMEAYELYHITRLSGRIYDLRHRDGVLIDQETRSSKNKDGVTVLYDEFFISPKNKVVPTW